MSLPYFPMFPKDFEAKTSHLTMMEDGAYNRLLRLCWMTPGCSLPNDETWICRRAKATTKAEREAISAVLAEFFKPKRDRIHSPKLTEIWREANAAHSKRVSAGKKGGSAKALKTNKTQQSNATAMPKQPEPEPEPYKKEDTNVSSQKKRGTRLSGEWALPKAWGDWAISQGFDADVIRLEAEKFKDYWTAKAGKDGVKLDWLATWRNWMRNANGKRPNNSRPHRPGGPSPHSALHAAFGSVGGYDDGGSAGPSGGLRDVTPSGATGLDCGASFDASKPLLRVINE